MPAVRRGAQRTLARRGSRLCDPRTRRRDRYEGRSRAPDRLRRVERRAPHVGADAGDVDYVNLHGTATPQNDEVEAALVARAFPASTWASSTKGWTGHTLGAAGIVEAVITLIALRDGFVPGTLNSETLDAACGPQVTLANRARAPRIALSNSFGFGGNNCCLAFARVETA